MMRKSSPVFVVGLTTVGLLLAPAIAQQPSQPKSLIERLGSLRRGWLSSEAEQAEDARAPQQAPQQGADQARPGGGPRAPRDRRAAQPQTSVSPLPVSRVGSRSGVPPRVASLPDSRGRRLPRVNPRDLLPREFRGPAAAEFAATVDRALPTEDENRPPADAAPLEAAAASPDAGSVRSRILRDLRQEAIDQPQTLGQDTAAAERRPEPRAGSNLSPAEGVAKGPSNAGQIRERITAQPLSRDFLRQATKGQATNEQETSKQAAKTPTEARQPLIDEQRAAINRAIAAEVAERLSTAEPPAATAQLDAQAEAETKTGFDAESGGAVAAGPPVAPNRNANLAVNQPAAVVDPFEGEPASVGRREEPVAVAAQTTADRSAAPASPALAPAPSTERISIGEGPVDSAPAARSAVVSLSTGPSGPFADRAPARGRLASEGEDILITQSTPQITAKVLGPRRVVIGQSSRFQVHLGNRGSAAATDLAARVLVPEWAEVASITTTSGSVTRPDGPAAPVRWRMDRFPAGESATMDMTLIAREGRPIELGVDWTHAPVSSRAFVEVQEPKLRMQISGPDEVYYAKPQLFRLTLSNPGTGVAEGVSLLLAPPGKPLEGATRHVIGDLRPGASTSVEIELTAREAGRLALAARAEAAGGVEASVDKQVFCRKPEIEIDWRGPQQKYTGAPATYYFRVRNAGTAPAEGVNVDVVLPEGFELTSASEGQSYDSGRRLLRWRVGTLRAGDDHYMELKGVARTDGQKRLVARAETGDQLIRDELTAVTDVIAVADLKLDVRDPKGPLPVGADAVYEVRVTNRGSNVAEAVEVIALFSGGIEPISVEGRPCRIADGRVSAPVIDRLPAGAEVLLRIHAKAIKPGTHIFRAEVACRDLEIRLAAEEMTRFYADDAALGGEEPRSAGAADRFTQPR